MAVELEWLLDKLCVDLGFCLPRHEQERLLALRFDDAEALAREILTAEGLDPQEPDRLLYTAVLAMVRRYYVPPPAPDTADPQRRLMKAPQNGRRRTGREVVHQRANGPAGE